MFSVRGINRPFKPLRRRHGSKARLVTVWRVSGLGRRGLARQRLGWVARLPVSAEPMAALVPRRSARAHTMLVLVLRLVGLGPRSRPLVRKTSAREHNMPALAPRWVLSAGNMPISAPVQLA